MWTFLDQRPILETGYTINSKATSFVAVLADERWAHNSDMAARVRRLAVQLMNDTQQEKTPCASKLLIVTIPHHPYGQTLVYINLGCPDQLRTAKRLLERLFAPFGDHIVKRAIASAHTMNRRDEEHIKRWVLASDCAFSVDPMVHPHTDEGAASSTAWQQCRKHASNLSECERAADVAGCAPIVVCAGAPAAGSGPSTEGDAHTQSQLCVQTLAITELESKLTALSLQSAENAREERELLSRISELDEIYKSTVHTEDTSNERELLRRKIKAAKAKHDEVCAGGVTIRADLGTAKLDLNFMQDSQEQCVLAVLNFRPDAVMHRVDFISEAEREELIKDNLPPHTHYNVKRLLDQEDEGTEEARTLHTSITTQVMQTGLDLMDEGSLPDFRANHRHKGEFINRVINTTKHLTRTAPSKEWCAKQLRDTNMKECCTQCHNKLKSGWGDRYLVIETGAWKPMSELAAETRPTDQLAWFCSKRCHEKWSEVLVCPVCGTFEYTKDDEHTIPDPADMLNMVHQYLSRARRRRARPAHTHMGGDVEGHRGESMWPREPRNIRVPICVSCSAVMLPRDPWSSHLQWRDPYV